MKKFLLFLRWFAYNAAIIAVGYYGFYLNVTWAHRAAVFIIWLTFAISLFAFSDDFVKAVAEIKPGVPFEINATVDLVSSVAIAALGHWFLAIIWFWQILATGKVEHFRRETHAQKQ